MRTKRFLLFAKKRCFARLNIVPMRVKLFRIIFFVLKNMASSGGQYSSPLGMGGGLDGSYFGMMIFGWWLVKNKSWCEFRSWKYVCSQIYFCSTQYWIFSKYFASMCPLFYPERQWLMKSFLSCHSKWSSLKISFSSLRDTKGPDQALCNLKLKW